MTTTLLREPAVADDLGQLLASIESLPTIPETLIAILNVLDDPDSGPADLAQAVRRDAPLMAKILQLANSPYYSPRGGIADINRCVAVLGYRTVRQVAVCASVATVLVKAVSTASGQLDYRELWQHSVVTGAVAKELARLAGHSDPEEVFTAGLLHDVGKFILELYAPEAYTDLIAERARARTETLAEAEKRCFGFDHSAVGAAFARLWRFPEILVATFADHHADSRDAEQDKPTAPATALVALADHLSHELVPSRSDLGHDPRFVDEARLFRTAELTPDTVTTAMPVIREAIDQAAVYITLT